MSNEESAKYVSRGGLKLEKALEHFKIDLTGLTCADLGSHKGGFVDCQIQHGSGKTYSVDTSYGTLAWTLRQNHRVIVVERCNALHWRPEEDLDFVSLDVGWTPQDKILPVINDYLKVGGQIVSLLKPQYESSDDERVKGLVKPECLEAVVKRCLGKLEILNFIPEEIIESPIKGGKGNIEYLMHLKKLK
jgi:23S rRNA (cytidine1920-2'-O)/16S rRNA (cytidine1409-2'-O)-methyltransferase